MSATGTLITLARKRVQFLMDLEARTGRLLKSYKLRKLFL